MLRKKIAIVGAGIAGNTCAYLLHKNHDCILFEAEPRLGGHANTQRIDDEEGEHWIDTGFIVYNERNYPLFSKMLQQLGVDTQESDMSFAFFDEALNFAYAGTGPMGLFAQKRRLFQPKIYSLAYQAYRFYRKGRSFLEQPSRTLSFQNFLDTNQFSSGFIREYILPMSSAIWSASANSVLQMPAVFALSFFDNHGLLDLSDRPKWRTISGGSIRYVEALFRGNSAKVIRNCSVRQIDRESSSIKIQSDSDDIEVDEVIIAVHADSVLGLLANPSPQELEIFGQWRYQQNPTQLHTDEKLLPPKKRAWASWNYLRKRGDEEKSPTRVSYHMNRLQNIGSSKNYIVSLNQEKEIDPSQILYKKDYSHPQFATNCLDLQDRIKQMNGLNRTHFVGAYLGNGFHEDAVRSAVSVCEKLGGGL